MAGKPRKRHPVVQPLTESYRYIPLTRNQNAIVDAEDFKWLSQWSWVARWDPEVRSFYATRTAYNPKRSIQMHRLILGCKPGEFADHENHDTLDNRRKNLRRATGTQNSANTRRWIKSSTGFKGVSFRYDKWRARIFVRGRAINLGQFYSAEAAAYAYDQAAKNFFGEFAHVNGVLPTASKSG